MGFLAGIFPSGRILHLGMKADSCHDRLHCCYPSHGLEGPVKYSWWERGWEKPMLCSLGITASHCLTKRNILCESMQRDRRRHILKRTNIALK